MSALGYAVLHVLSLGSKRHVIDIAASRIVTEVNNDERLASFLINRDRAMLGFPRDPVGTLLRSIVPDSTVTSIKLCALKGLARTLQAVGRWGFFQFTFQSVDGWCCLSWHVVYSI
ncbi:hypothetical protein HK17_16095 [Acetobacter indonesiensis]|uniref:Uncharacterized protein n=1 Tax=Acetobacter indonesiensis TaxID=104101 RepID=A0A252AHF0_9PROT|nr:hypothetical protein HK17_16095 [Acetobacter indonesiensis]